MHKKLEGELLSLAHSILQMKNKEDINALQQKALALYEKLSMLKFVNAYLESETSEGVFSVEKKVEAPAPLADFTEELIDDVKEKVSETDSVQKIIEEDEKIAFEIDELTIETEETVVEKTSVKTETDIEDEVELTQDDVEEIFGTKKGMISEEEQNLRATQFSLEEEFKDAISADVATQMFENATKKNPILESKSDVKSRSLNDALLTSKLQVGLNDRIAFVKHLFDGSQEDFSRVLSQLNTFKTEKEAKDFIYNLVKPDYNWKPKEEYEARLIDLIERKFM